MHIANIDLALLQNPQQFLPVSFLREDKRCQFQIFAKRTMEAPCKNGTDCLAKRTTFSSSRRSRRFLPTTTFHPRHYNNATSPDETTSQRVRSRQKQKSNHQQNEPSTGTAPALMPPVASTRRRPRRFRPEDRSVLPAAATRPRPRPRMDCARPRSSRPSSPHHRPFSRVCPACRPSCRRACHRLCRREEPRRAAGDPDGSTGAVPATGVDPVSPPETLPPGTGRGPWDWVCRLLFG